MRTRNVLIIAVCFVAVLWWSAFTPAGDGSLTNAEFDKLHKELSSAKEPWQALPWQLSLVEARTQAAKENKPIYMLCRSGHPLGCV